MQTLILVALGGAGGAVARYLTGVSATRALGPGWPYGTFAVNVVGGFLMGALAGWLAQRGEADQSRWRALLGVGVLGGFTTFSAYSLEIAQMIERRAYGQALVYATASVVLATAALFAGMMLSRRGFA